MRIPRTEPRKARIEIIPMIDAIFFLLVFFMFSSLSMVRMKGMVSNLPTDKPGAGKGASAAAPPKLVVSVTPGGDYFLGKQKVTPATLEAALQASIDARPNAVVIVNVAKAQSTQTLIDVMDQINKVTPPKGAALSVLIATEPIDANGMALNSRPGDTPGDTPKAQPDVSR